MLREINTYISDMPQETFTGFLYVARRVFARFVRKNFARKKPLSGKFQDFVPLGAPCMKFQMVLPIVMPFDVNGQCTVHFAIPWEFYSGWPWFWFASADVLFDLWYNVWTS